MIAAGAVAACCFVLLAVGLWRTVFFLRRRMRIRLSVPLLAAALPLLVVPWLAADGVRAQLAQHDAVPYADVLARDSSPEVEVSAERDPLAEPDPAAIRPAAARMEQAVRDGELGGIDVLAGWVAPLGVLVGAVAGGALHVYRREYLLVGRGGGVSA
ncbi:hypothetical protein V2W30_22430 [Streptomyces sp. Q6]|uniref:Uncharacterized protein n=1 Tax=Streptomyces citrinus TaxID=3118173 RepID=A0ACD5AFI5_9ACTN